MRRQQWLCSKCGFACPSAWQILMTSTPKICNTCRSKEANNKVKLEPKQLVNEEVKNNTPFADKISSSTSTSHQNVALSVSQIGMIFGNLTFEPTLAIPLIFRGKSLAPRVKSEVFTDDDKCVTGVQHHVYGGESLKPSITTTVGDSTIQIKQENIDYDELEAEKEVIWESSKVKRKKRSKLPQYTLSPLARFINHLQQASCCNQRRRVRPKLDVNGNGVVGPKYDDYLIYAKCANFIPDYEIGLGAELLAPPGFYPYPTITTPSSSHVPAKST